jgi:hypothetical protein
MKITIKNRANMTYDEHLAWCKQRALEYVNTEELSNNAWALMVSYLKEHPETAHHPGIEMGTLLRSKGCLKTPEEMRRFIEAFR